MITYDDYILIYLYSPFRKDDLFTGTTSKMVGLGTFVRIESHIQNFVVVLLGICAT